MVSRNQRIRAVISLRFSLKFLRLLAVVRSYPSHRFRQLNLGAKNAPVLRLTVSNSEITVLQIGFGHQLLRGSAPHAAAALDQVMPVADTREMSDILVDHQDRLPLRFQHR